MANRPRPDELRRQLEEKKEAIHQRIDALQTEVVTTPESIKDAVASSPWVGVGAAVAAGLAVGLLFGGRKKKAFDIHRHQAPHRALVNRYVDAMVHEVRRAVDRGHDPDEAVREALEGRVPLIVVQREDHRDHPGFFRQALDLTLKTALGFAVKTAIDVFAANLDVEQIQQFMEETVVQSAETEAMAAEAAAEASEAKRDATEAKHDASTARQEATRAEAEARHAPHRPDAGTPATGPGPDVPDHPRASKPASASRP